MNPYGHVYNVVLCFHPTQPIIACAGYSKNDNTNVILLSASNSSIPFNNWNKPNGTPYCKETILAMKWNVSQMNLTSSLRCEKRFKIFVIKLQVDGTLLAVLSIYDIYVFSYPGCKIIFQIGSGYLREDRFEWNPFRPSVLSILFNLVLISFFSAIVSSDLFNIITFKFWWIFTGK